LPGFGENSDRIHHIMNLPLPVHKSEFIGPGRQGGIDAAVAVIPENPVEIVRMHIFCPAVLSFPVSFAGAGELFEFRVDQ